ncbi:hypothetical protein ACWCXX_20085 [Streptomyces sp. NPDC001732]
MSQRTMVKCRSRHQDFRLVLGQVRNLVQHLDLDEEHNHERNHLTGELLARHADRCPALTRAIAADAFAPDDTDPLAFGLERILDGVQALIGRTPID